MIQWLQPYGYVFRAHCSDCRWDGDVHLSLADAAFDQRTHDRDNLHRHAIPNPITPHH